MAAFNKEGTGSPDPNYLGYSKEPTRPRAVDYSGIFAGIGDTIHGVATGIDENNKTNIDEALYKGVDQERDAQGVALVTDAAAKDQSLFPGKEGAKVPPGVVNHIEGIDKLQGAFAEGKIDPAYYYGKLNLLAKQVRSQYPNYRDYIDSKISTIAGVNPANALRSQISSNLAAQAAAQQSKFDDKQKLINANQGKLMLENPRMLSNPEEFSVPEINLAVGRVEARQLKYTQENNDISLQIARGKLDGDKNERVVANRLADITNISISAALKSIGPRIGQIIKGEVKPTQDELNQINGQLQLLKNEAVLKQNSILTETIPGTGDTLSSIIKDPGKIKQYREEALAPIDALMDAFKNGMAGNAKLIADLAQSKSDGAFSEAMEIPGYKLGDQLRRLPPMFLEHLAVTRPDIIGTVTGTLITKSVADTMTGNKKSIMDKVRSLAPPDAPMKNGKINVQPSEVKQMLRDHREIFRSKDVPDAQKAIAAADLFSEGNRGWLGELFTGPSRITAYNMFVDKEMAKEMLRLDGGTPGENFRNYSEFAKSGFHDLLKGEADALSDADKNNPNAHISFDPGSLTYKVEAGSSAAGVDDNAKANVKEDLGRVGKTLQDSANRLNAGLANLKPVFEIEGVKDPTQVVEQLTGFKVTDEKQAGFFHRMWEKAKNIEFFTPDREAPKKHSDINLDGKDTKTADLSGEPGSKSADVASLPAGMRNNNPGNIKYVGQAGSTGPSKNTDQGDPQAVYATPEEGMAAAAELAFKKWQGGKNTLHELIASQGGWTPGNRQAAANIAKSMGVDSNDEIDLSNPKVMAKFLRGLVRQEHGTASDRYSDDLIESGVSKVLRTKSASK